jgi:probable phosphoglycerate mutase
MANVEGVIASDPAIARTEFGLSPAGIDQAREAGRDFVQMYIREHGGGGSGGGSAIARPVVALLASDLLRARETAEIVRDAILAHNIGRHASEAGGEQDFDIPLHTGDVILETRLRERGFGEWDGTSDANYQRVWDDDAVDSSTARRGVEPVDSVMSRATQAVVDWDRALSSLVDDEAGTSGSAPAPPACVIAVAHGDVLQILQTAFEKMDGTLHRTLPHLETATLRPLVLRDG